MCTFTLLREVPEVPSPTVKQNIPQGDLWPSMCSVTLGHTLMQGPKKNAKVNSMANRFTKKKQAQVMK